MNAVLEAIQEAVAGVAERVGPAVVGLGRGWSRGSGVVIASGRVLTAAHVLRGDELAVVFADGRSATGRVLGADPDLDVAVVSSPRRTCAAVSTRPGAITTPDPRAHPRPSPTTPGPTRSAAPATASWMASRTWFISRAP